MNRVPYRIGLKDIKRERLEILTKTKRRLKKHKRREEPIKMRGCDKIRRTAVECERLIKSVERHESAKKRNTVAGAFFGKLAASAKDQRENPAEQHVTTATELKADIHILRKRYTSSEGLDAARYCSALNIWRDNILFTAGELKTAAEEARRSEDAAAVPGYKVLINRCQTNAGLLAKEIKSVGGTVNK